MSNYRRSETKLYNLLAFDPFYNREKLELDRCTTPRETRGDRKQVAAEASSGVKICAKCSLSKRSPFTTQWTKILKKFTVGIQTV